MQHDLLQKSDVASTDEIPRWPRLLARIFGTIGLVMTVLMVLAIVAEGVSDLVTGEGTDELISSDYVYITAFAASEAVMGLGFLIAWWREGLGALLIFAGVAFIGLMTFGAALPFIFPAVVVGALYLLSWALHREGGDSESRLDRLSRRIRREFYGRRSTAA